MQRKFSGFSLVELLVVIAVIGILSALVLAALAGAKARSLQSQCANNVKQLGGALHLFLTDHSAYPLFFKSNDEGMWAGALENELSGHNVFYDKGNLKYPVPYPAKGAWHCPAAERPASYPSQDGYEDYGYNAYGLSTFSNTDSLGLGGHSVLRAHLQPIPEDSGPPVKESEVINPVDMMAVGDGFDGDRGVIRDGSTLLGRTPNVQDYLGSTKRAVARHRGKANVVFCDGHVESPTLKSLFEDETDAALIRWNRDHQPHREKLSR